MTPRTTTCKSIPGSQRGDLRCFAVTIREPFRTESYDIIAHNGLEAVEHARDMFDGRGVPARMVNHMADAA